MEQIGDFMNISAENLYKLSITLLIAFGLTILRIIIMMVVKRIVTEQTIWEDILLAFNKEKNINLAYPTTRFYTEPQS